MARVYIQRRLCRWMDQESTRRATPRAAENLRHASPLTPTSLSVTLLVRQKVLAGMIQAPVMTSLLTLSLKVKATTNTRVISRHDNLQSTKALDKGPLVVDRPEFAKNRSESMMSNDDGLCNDLTQGRNVGGILRSHVCVLRQAHSL
mmetsp:Transcript_18566/g.49869  ORF Transcript_18566/g.49869 Transcript_18566/m.49869 type:complete len:147 (-) Transcript_18566:66-506(-)